MDYIAGWDSTSVYYYYIEQCPTVREKEKIWWAREKYPNNPQPHLLQAQYALTLLIAKPVECPGNESHPAPSSDCNHPPHSCKLVNIIQGMD